MKIRSRVREARARWLKLALQTAETNLPSGLNELAIADFNNDGLMDIVSAYAISDTADNITFEHHLVLVKGRALITIEE